MKLSVELLGMTPMDGVSPRMRPLLRASAQHDVTYDTLCCLGPWP